LADKDITIAQINGSIRAKLEDDKKIAFLIILIEIVNEMLVE